MSREEAAAKALCQHPRTWDNAPEVTRTPYRLDARRALEAADAVMLSDATVERAARSLHEHAPQVHYLRGGGLVPWDALSEGQKDGYCASVRAVLAAAVEAGQ